MVRLLGLVQRAFVELISPMQVEGPGGQVAVLDPSPLYQHPLHPQIFGVENKYLGALLYFHPLDVLGDELVEVFAATIDDLIHVNAPQLPPLLLSPQVIHFLLYVSPEAFSRSLFLLRALK